MRIATLLTMLVMAALCVNADIISFPSPDKVSVGVQTDEFPTLVWYVLNGSSSPKYGRAVLYRTTEPGEGNNEVVDASAYFTLGVGERFDMPTSYNLTDGHKYWCVWADANATTSNELILYNINGSVVVTDPNNDSQTLIQIRDNTAYSKTVLDDIKAMIDVIKTNVINMLNTFTTSLNAIKDLVIALPGQIATSIQSFFSSLSDKITTLNDQISGGFTTFWGWLGNILQAIRDAVTAFTTLIQSVIETITVKVAEIVTQIANGIASVLLKIAELATFVGQKIAEFYSNLTAWILSWWNDDVKPWWGGVISTVKERIDETTTQVVQTSTAIKERITEKVTETITNMTSLAATTWGKITDVLNTVETWGQSLWTKVTDFAGQVAQIAVTLWSKLEALSASIGEFFATLSTSVGQWFSSLGQNLMTWFGEVGSALSSVKSSLESWAGQIWDKVRLGFEAMPSLFASVVTRIGDALTAFTDFVTLLWARMTAYVETITAFIGQQFTALQTALEDYWTTVQDWTGELWTKMLDLKDTFVNSLASGFQAVVASLTSIGESISNTYTAITTTIADALSQLGVKLVEGWQAVVGGLVAVGEKVVAFFDDFKARAIELMAKVGDFWDFITDEIFEQSGRLWAFVHRILVPTQGDYEALANNVNTFINWGPVTFVQSMQSCFTSPPQPLPVYTLTIMGKACDFDLFGPILHSPQRLFLRGIMAVFIWLGFIMLVIGRLLPQFKL